MTGSFGKKYFPDGLDFYRGISNSYYTVTYSYNDKQPIAIMINFGEELLVSSILIKKRLPESTTNQGLFGGGFIIENLIRNTFLSIQNKDCVNIPRNEKLVV